MPITLTCANLSFQFKHCKMYMVESHFVLSLFVAVVVSNP